MAAIDWRHSKTKRKCHDVGYMLAIVPASRRRRLDAAISAIVQNRKTARRGR
ncbi:hypothetical protein [Bradyrhizobium hipponense]|uniref:hypothetical protein n=1 Tax=Bradyrhizobium hipponense TaxID=2605638 RepID=UPI001653255A|nr:hypothetical protein [Bradyrhizobium hipponense]